MTCANAVNRTEGKRLKVNKTKILKKGETNNVKKN
jgi:hypothetical protein